MLKSVNGTKIFIHCIIFPASLPSFFSNDGTYHLPPHPHFLWYAGPAHSVPPQGMDLRLSTAFPPWALPLRPWCPPHFREWYPCQHFMTSSAQKRACSPAQVAHTYAWICMRDKNTSQRVALPAYLSGTLLDRWCSCAPALEHPVISKWPLSACYPPASWSWIIISVHRLIMISSHWLIHRCPHVEHLILSQPG